MHAYRSAEKNGEWLTMTEAAAKLGITNHVIRKLIKDDVLPAEQVVPGAPYQIRASDLENDRITDAVMRKGRPCRADRSEEHTSELQSLMRISYAVYCLKKKKKLHT